MIDRLKKIVFLEKEFDLYNFNTYKVHSICYCIVYPKDIQQLKSVIQIIKEYNSKYFVLGNGSNIILPEYYDGVVIKLNYLNKMIFKNGNIYVESGYMINKLANKVSSLGYTGFEWATGIPGTVGGSIYNNAGAYNKSINELLTSIICLDEQLNIVEYDPKKIFWGYRDSFFKKNTNIIILSCSMEVEKGNLEEIKNLIQERTNKRIQTQDLNNPSCGSVFRNPEGLYAGKLIEESNLKGYKINDAMISNKHANFIINSGNATGKDIIKLIKHIKKKIKKDHNVDLILEQEIIK